MGQRPDSAVRQRIAGRSSPPTVRLNVAVFPTDLGWFALAGGDGRVQRLLIGHRTDFEVRAALDAEFGDEFKEADWNPDLRERLQCYARGENVAFDAGEFDIPPDKTFTGRVLNELVRVGYGETITYAELAARAGSPRAARAVGNAMASNRVPILIPCHRVVAAGTLGGFSAPQGVALKERMLALEAERCGILRPKFAALPVARLRQE